MKKVEIAFLLVLFTITAGVLTAAPDTDAISPDPATVPDPYVEEGFFFDGIEGVLVRTGNSDIWKFAPNEDVFITDERNYPAGKALPMLPCSVLEQMTEAAGNDTKMSVRLWALFTEYNKVNYLFGVYFLPLEETIAQSLPAVDETQTDDTEEPAAEPERDSIIPENILKQIKSHKTPDLKKFQQISQVSGDLNLVGRSGHLIFKDDTRRFQPDAFGMKVDRTEYELLPSHMRGKAEMQMMTTPGRDRYNVSGLVTQYKGKTYMLLWRVARTYDHGNFSG